MDHLQQQNPDDQMLQYQQEDGDGEEEESKLRILTPLLTF